MKERIVDHIKSVNYHLQTFCTFETLRMIGSVGCHGHRALNGNMTRETFGSRWIQLRTTLFVIRQALEVHVALVERLKAAGADEASLEGEGTK